MIGTLAELVAPADVDVFLQHFITNTRWFASADAPARASSLLPWSEIDRLIANHGAPPEQIRVVVNRNEAERSMYRDEKSGALRANALQELAAQGATVVINGISNLVPQIAELAASIERQLSHRVNVNCYISFGRHSAFHEHYDDHDVLVLQVHGSKHWRCYGVDVSFPVHGGHTSTLTTPVRENVLGPGDVLYVPRGDVHAAVPVQRPSVHLTLGITEHIGADFIKWLGNKAESDEVFRMGLARNAPTQHRAAREHEVKQALHALIDATPIAEYFADDDRKRPTRSVAAFDFDRRLGPDSILVSALRRRIDLEIGDDEELKVEIGGNQIRLPALTRRALHVATENSGITFASLATELGRDTTDRELIESLGDLARKALIEIVA